MFNKLFYRYSAKWLFLLFLVFSVSGIQLVSADQIVLGPRAELGVRFDGFSMLGRPEWCSKYYGAGMITVAYRLLFGLSVHGAMGFGLGDELVSDWFDYGEDFKIKATRKTYTELSWAGLRYEIPMKTLGLDYAQIDIVYCSLGMMYTTYGIKSRAWEDSGVIEEGNETKLYRMAEVSGPYAELAARWRLDTDITMDTGSWLGALGVDLGVRYIHYTDSKVAFDNIKKPASAFSSFEVFLVGSMKMSFFY